MYPSFTSLSDRERKRQELLREVERELAIEKRLDQMYSEAMWAADNEASMISLTPGSTSTSDAQTNISIPPSSNATVATSSVYDAGLRPRPGADGSFSAPTNAPGSLTGDISIAPTSTSTQASDLIGLDMDHVMYRPDETMDEAVSKRENEQQRAHKVIVELYKANPDIASWDLHPIFDPIQVKDAKAMRDMFFLGPQAKLYHRQSRKAVRQSKQDDLVDQIDWEETFKYIQMKVEAIDGFTKARQLREAATLTKDAFDAFKDNAREPLDASRGALDSIMGQIVVDNMSKDSRTDSIEADSKQAFIQLVKNNRDVMKAHLMHDFNGKPGFYAVRPLETLKGQPSMLTDTESNTYYIDPINFRIRRSIDHRQSNTKEKQMSWAASLDFLLQQAQNHEISLDTSGTSLRTAVKRSLEDSTVSGINLEQKRPNLNELSRSVGSNINMVEAAGDYKRLIYDIYTDNPWLLREYLPPAVSKVNITDPPSDFYIDLNAGIRRKKKTKSGSPPADPDLSTDSLASAKTLERMNMDWARTFEGVIDYLIQVVKYYEDNPDRLRADGFSVELKQVRETLKRYNIVLPNYMPLQMEDLEMTGDTRGRQTLGLNPESLGSQPSVSGRGLRGAGYQDRGVRDKDGNPIKYNRSRGYNLTQLEGTPHASAMAYKRVGTKFIHLPKLNEGLLKVVYPCKSAVGAQRKLSGDLAKLIKALVFDGKIDQALYESMSIEDKRTFHELLKITHTQHSLREPLKDPREVLKQEYAKLKGELMLGNDNPQIIAELKRVLIDMYSSKLINDSEFKEVLLALV